MNKHIETEEARHRAEAEAGSGLIEPEGRGVGGADCPDEVQRLGAVERVSQVPDFPTEVRHFVFGTPAYLRNGSVSPIIVPCPTF